MIGDVIGHLLKCVMHYGKFINISEIKHIEKKHCCYNFNEILCKNLYLEKCHDKTNMSPYFDQFIVL